MAKEDGKNKWLRLTEIEAWSRRSWDQGIEAIIFDSTSEVSSRELSNRDRMQPTYVIWNFLVATFKKYIFIYISIILFIFLYFAALGLSCSTGDPHCLVWDLVPWPGIEPRPPALGVWSLNHWTTGKSLVATFLNEEETGEINFNNFYLTPNIKNIIISVCDQYKNNLIF